MKNDDMIVTLWKWQIWYSLVLLLSCYKDSNSTTKKAIVRTREERDEVNQFGSYDEVIGNDNRVIVRVCERVKTPVLYLA